MKCLTFSYQELKGECTMKIWIEPRRVTLEDISRNDPDGLAKEGELGYCVQGTNMADFLLNFLLSLEGHMDHYRHI